MIIKWFSKVYEVNLVVLTLFKTLVVFGNYQ